MKYILFSLLVTSIAFAQQKGDNTYNQPYRPQFHFSPKINWINDPNGLVYYEGEYHLFYQYNPFGDKWGHMTWGHAVSKDLQQWQELAPAIAEENNVMIFSGCVVADTLNTSKLGNGNQKPLIAIYTGHEQNKQSQHLAYSLDKGRTWVKYAHNPVLDFIPTQKDFRDPNVIWYEPLKVWLMTVVLPTEQKALFYHSKNLKEWTQAGEFQVKNKDIGIWECPALIPFSIGENKKWVLLISVGNGAVAGGSGMQYFVGDFDGKNFTPQDTQIRWVDYGKDFYAAIPFNHTKENIVLGWMNNWQYANDIPTAPFRGQMTLPRKLSLTAVRGKYELRQKPISQHVAGNIQNLYINALNKSIAQQNQDYFGLIVTAAAKDFSIIVKGGTKISYDAKNQLLTCDRTKSGKTHFHKEFPTKTTALVAPNTDGTIKLQMLIDRCSVEIFANDGAISMTNLIFPTISAPTIFEGNAFKKVEYYKPVNAWQ